MELEKMVNSKNSYLFWLNNILDQKIKKQLKNLNKEQIVANFSNSLIFGTAGMRGTMQLGTNNINVVTVCKLAQSLSVYMAKHGKQSIVICFDTRTNSKKFSRIFAKVMSKNKINVYLFKKFAPTPICVYATTKLKADFGVMITASHNNKQYNGIKIYGNLGIQIGSDVQREISQIFNEVNEIEIYNKIYKSKLKNNIHYLTIQISKDFVKMQKSNYKKNLKIIYTPLNGTGRYCVSNILKTNGYSFKMPKTQKEANGLFKTCPYPNPEFKEAFTESLKLSKKFKADIIVATDPDADRIGVMVKHNDKYIKLSGNEVGYIFAEYLINKNNSENKFIVTSVVTSPLINEICKKNNVHLFKTLTGFKSLGTKTYEVCKKYGKSSFVLCYEESCGYVVNSNYYDKDGIYATLLICEIANSLKCKNKTLIDYLNDIYNKYSYIEALSDSIIYNGKDSLKQMNNVVENLRKHKIEKILNYKVTKTVDYLNDETGLEKQNFIEYHLKDIIFIIRPSGTEPKLKIYLFVKGEQNTAKDTAKKVLNKIKSVLNNE